MNESHIHWLDGGTGLTNFDPEELSIYEEAVKTWKGEGEFWIEKFPMPNGWEQPLPSLYSLHRENDGKDCGPFWDHFKKIRAILKSAQ